MKILILANDAEGLYKFRKELIEELIKRGNQVYISLPTGEFIEQLKSMGCELVQTKIDRRGINPKKDAKLMLFYLNLIRTIHPDKVITYTIKPNIYGGIMCRFLHTPYAVNITGLGTAFQKEGMIKKIVTCLYKVALKRAKVVFFENVENRNIMMDMDIVKRKQTYVLNGAGVNLNEYRLAEYPKNDEIRFLFIGRVMKEKGIDEFLEVAVRLKKEKQNIYFDIVGPMEEDYQKRIQELVEKKIIEYHGYQKDVKPFIKRCHCFVLPSYHEGMANTLLEAAAMGRPLITSKIHGCMEAVENNVTGFLCEVQDTESLYLAMLSFIDLMYEKRKSMGIAGRKKIEENFDKRMVVKNTINELSTWS